MVEFRLEDNLALWRYKDLSVIGVVGMLDDSLQEVRNKLILNSSYEVAPVKKEIGRDFLGVVIPESPFREITFDQNGSHEGAIVMYSLSEDTSRRTMNEILGKIPFHPNPSPNKDFIETLRIGLGLEIKAYSYYELLARQLGTTKERTFSAARYANFLNRYQEIPENKALERALNKFPLRREL